MAKPKKKAGKRRPPVKKQAGSAKKVAAGAQPRTQPTQAQRLNAARRQRRRRAQRTRVLIGVGLAVIVLGIAAAVFLRGGVPSELSVPGCRHDTRSDSDSGAGSNHVSNPTYEVNPPAGGDHLAQAAPNGVFSGGTVPEDGLLVHSLEHGYVILWHDPDLPQDEFQKILEVRNDFTADVLVVPRDNMPTPVAATAWHHRVLCDEVKPAALRAFVEWRRNQGPEKVPHE